VAEASHAVFLSYASQDAEAAQKIGMPGVPPTRSPRSMRYGTMQRRPLRGSIGPGATATRALRPSSMIPSSCASRTTHASPPSAGRWACRRLQRLESGLESEGRQRMSALRSRPALSKCREHQSRRIIDGIQGAMSLERTAGARNEDAEERKPANEVQHDNRCCGCQLFARSAATWNAAPPVDACLSADRFRLRWRAPRV
jgi:hypothetical protein